MKRVAIIGCPGAGKTTFARQLASITGLPLIHLDKIYHDTDHAYATNRQAWRTRVAELVSQPLWIIDGNYKSTFDIRLPAADTIIFLDYPTRLTVSRAIKRRITLRKTVRPDMPASWKEKLDWQFFTFILRYRRKERPAVLRILAKQPQAMVFHITEPKAAQELLRKLRY